MPLRFSFRSHLLSLLHLSATDFMAAEYAAAVMLVIRTRATVTPKRVEVLYRSGHFIRVLGEEGIKRGPTAIHIVDKYVYVGENDHILVYKTSGQFVTSFAIAVGYDEWSFSISFCADGFMYVCCWAKATGDIKTDIYIS